MNELYYRISWVNNVYLLLVHFEALLTDFISLICLMYHQAISQMNSRWHWVEKHDLSTFNECWKHFGFGLHSRNNFVQTSFWRWKHLWAAHPLWNNVWPSILFPVDHQHTTLIFQVIMARVHNRQKKHDDYQM